MDRLEEVKQALRSADFSTHSYQEIAQAIAGPKGKVLSLESAMTGFLTGWKNPGFGAFDPETGAVDIGNLGGFIVEARAFLEHAYSGEVITRACQHKLKGRQSIPAQQRRGDWVIECAMLEYLAEKALSS